MSETTLRPDAGFSQFPLQATIHRGLEAIGFKEPRAVQARTIPAGLAGQDVLGLAQTGTGKTAAFVVPILERLLTLRRPGPRALILAPTRELAMQIHAELETLAQFTGLKAVTVFGGVPAAPQIRALRARPDIIVACPGRLLDLMGQGVAKLSGVEVLVLDEADHMFDMGFLPDIREIIAALPEKRQNLMFSATMPAEIRKLANQILKDPHVVELGHSAPAPTVAHELYRVSMGDKLGALRKLLAGEDVTSAIIFLRTKHRTKRLAEQLTRSGHNAVALEGNMSQAQRDRAMGGFRSGKYQVLVATDIAARGIDVANVSHVINFDIPETLDTYTHRIGRTGRSERSGKACTLFCSQDLPLVHTLERKLGKAIKRREIPDVEVADLPEEQVERRQGRTDATNGRHAPKGGHRAGGQGRRQAGSRPNASAAPAGNRRRRRRRRPARTA